jgi:hypothetical protein
LVLQCISGVSSIPIEGRTNIWQLKYLILTLFGLIFRRIYMCGCGRGWRQSGNYHASFKPKSEWWITSLIDWLIDWWLFKVKRALFQLYIYTGVYIRLKIKPNSVRIRFQSWYTCCKYKEKRVERKHLCRIYCVNKILT